MNTRRPARGPWTSWAEQTLQEIDASGQRRRLRTFDAIGPQGELAGGERVVTFAANDYLGLSAHPAVLAAATDALERWGAGAGASRLVTGSRPVHAELEAELADWKGAEAALVFPTGYSANLGVLSTFGQPGVTILSDELNHASIIDGARLARAEVRIYRHNDLDHLRRLLPTGGRVLIVTDAVFSMDGDEARVPELAQLAARHGALLVLDEAHSVLSGDVGLDGTEVLRVGTLSKTLGSLGGFVAGPSGLIDVLVNRARSLIFTTALTPSDTAAALAALRVLRSAEGAVLRQRLRSLVERVRPGHPSPIVPIVLGSERAALAASEALLRAGLLVPAIRPPTVAPGTSRLRVALSAAHTDDQVRRLLAALEQLHVPA